MSVPRISRTSRVPRPGIDWFNKVGQAVNAHEQRSKAFGPRQARGLNLDPDRLIVLVKNTTLSDIGRYRPIDIDGAALEESDDILLLGVDPHLFGEAAPVADGVEAVAAAKRDRPETVPLNRLCWFLSMTTHPPPPRNQMSQQEPPTPPRHHRWQHRSPGRPPGPPPDR